MAALSRISALVGMKPAPSRMPRANNDVFVTKLSSPISWTLPGIQNFSGSNSCDRLITMFVPHRLLF